MSRFSHKLRVSYIPDPDGNLDAGNHLSWNCRLIMRKFGRKNRKKSVKRVDAQKAAEH
jgi:hypothetical protein